MSLVPIAELGHAFGVATPAIDTMVRLASIIHGVNYRARGRTLERLGLAGMTLDEVRRYVETGAASPPPARPARKRTRRLGPGRAAARGGAPCRLTGRAFRAPGARPAARRRCWWTSAAPSPSSCWSIPGRAWCLPGPPGRPRWPRASRWACAPASTTSPGPPARPLLAQASPRLACSSAAGGLRMVAVGLVRELTAAAAAAAALGAGARLLATYCHRLTAARGGRHRRPAPGRAAPRRGHRRGRPRDPAAQRRRPGRAAPGRARPAGGGRQQGGHPAGRGRRCAAPGTTPARRRTSSPPSAASRSGPAQEAIRRIFLEHIVHRKGLDGALAHLDGVVLPTPAAVLRAADLLAGDGGRGPGDRGRRRGDDGRPRRHRRRPRPPGGLRPGPARAPPQAHRRGRPGDAGQRPLHLGGDHRPLGPGPAPPGRPRGRRAPQDAVARVEGYAGRTDALATDAAGLALDARLAAGAVGLALERHAGTLEERLTPAGRFWVQRGQGPQRRHPGRRQRWRLPRPCGRTGRPRRRRRRRRRRPLPPRPPVAGPGPRPGLRALGRRAARPVAPHRRPPAGRPLARPVRRCAGAGPAGRARRDAAERAAPTATAGS